MFILVRRSYSLLLSRSSHMWLFFFFVLSSSFSLVLRAFFPRLSGFLRFFFSFNLLRFSFTPIALARYRCDTIQCTDMQRTTIQWIRVNVCVCVCMRDSGSVDTHIDVLCSAIPYRNGAFDWIPYWFEDRENITSKCVCVRPEKASAAYLHVSRSPGDMV